MALGIKTETWGGGDHSWLGSRHGVETAQTITLEADAFTVDDGIVKSGTPIVRAAEGGMAGPYAGTGTLLGFVLEDTDISGGDTPAAYLWHGRVKVDRLPVDFTPPADAGLFAFVGV